MRSATTLLSCGFMLVATAAMAQTPQSFGYQAVARDADGDALVDQAVGVQFQLHQGNTGGTVVYGETHSTTTNDHGLITLAVGSGTPTIGPFNAVNWRSGPYFLEVLLDAANSGSFSSLGTQQLLSVPYALHAGSSGNVPNGTEPGQVMHWDGTAWVVDSGLYVHQKRFGIGITEPTAPLSVRSRDQLHQHFENGDIPDQNDFMFSTGNNTGFGIDEDTVGGTVSRLLIQSGSGHVGIGDDDPPAPLSIESRNILKTYFETGDVPTQDQFGISTSSTGFDIGQGAPDALQSRFFIQASNGYVGMGTTLPTEKLHVESSTPAGLSGLKMLNTATATSFGWKVGHLQDAVPQLDGALVFSEPIDFGPGQGISRMTIRQGGNVGINEPIPDTKLHVSRPVSDPSASLALLEGTGIAVIGPITDNIVFDYRGIQARTGAYVGGGPVLTLSTADLNLQRLGGNILIHGDDAVTSSKAIVTSDAKLGLGTITPLERIDVDGAIRIGNTLSENEGAIRYTGSDFQGRVGGDWVVFNGSVWEKVDNTDRVYYNAGLTPRVGIGTATVDATLHVRESAAMTTGSTAALIQNHATTTSTGQDDNRVGLEITCDGTWGGSAASKNIGLYVSSVSGQTNAESNIAAVLNGNTVIGDLSSGTSSIGPGGSRVLVIQNGMAPVGAASGGSGLPDGGVQLYSTGDMTGVSTFHVMNGDGTVITLVRQTALTAPDASVVNGTYDGSEADVINNMRDPMNQLETKLQTLGLLTP